MAKFSCFQKFRFLSRKNHLSFQNPNFRVILLFQSTCGKFATFSILTKIFKIFSRKPHLFFKKKQFWTFWEILLFDFHLIAKLIPLAFSKKIQSFSENLIFLLKSKNTLNILRELPISIAFHSKIPTFSHFKMNSFFGESMYFFLTAKSLNVLRNVSVSVEFYCKNATASQFLHFRVFCSKNPFFLILKKPEVWTFWGLLQFQSILGQIFCLCHFKRFQFFSKTEVFLIISKSQKMNVLRNLTNSFALYSKFVTISDFWNIQDFFGKPIIFCKKQNSWTFWEI